MKSHKAIILAFILVVFTMIAAVFHFNTRQEVPENVIQIVTGEKTYTIDIEKLEYEQVIGVRINGKGEEIPVDEQGISVKRFLSLENIEVYSYISVVADDSYSAKLTAEEVSETGKAFLTVQEEGGLRLVVFGDENSKRSVSNVVQIIVE